MPKLTAYCFRTKMAGGGTSYDVYFQKSDKPSHPLHGHTYSTTILRSFHNKRMEFFDVTTAIDPESRWKMEPGIEKWNAHKALEKRAHRLAIRIARRAFPELKRLKLLPALWADWTLDSSQVAVTVNITLPA